MDKIHFEINGENEHLESIWVHLQKANYDSSVLYKIKIPVVYLEKIFDPYNTKNKTKSWEEFIEENIEELGTFIVEGYLKGMRSIAYKKRRIKRKKIYIKKFGINYVQSPKLTING